jgi:hypothetical protein
MQNKSLEVPHSVDSNILLLADLRNMIVTFKHWSSAEVL